MTVGIAFGISIALAAAVIAFMIAFAARPRFASRDAAFLWSVACIFGGWFVAITASPDWSPVTIFGLYLPFLLTGVCMAVVSSRRNRQA